MKKNLLLLSFSFLACALVQAQSNLFIDNSYTIEEMVTDFFDNPDVVTSNITYTGDPLSVAFFDAGGTDLGVNAGIVFSSGYAEGVVGPNGSGGNSATTTGGSDADLSDLNGGGSSSNDVAIIEFDFTINSSDTFNFNYVFGSEEYPEYVCSGFNDAFGFLVSGPGISGPYSNNAINITTIPGSNAAVSINNINDDPGCGPADAAQYYIDNSGDQDVQLDGLTTALPASFYAVGGETYHAKLVIGDIGDSVFDSAIFLSFNSLGSDSLLVPPAEFQFAANGNEINFTNTSKYAREWNWDFGNGVTSSERNPGTVAYSTPGTYTVSLTTQNFCCTDTYTTTVEVGQGNALAVDISTSNNPLACAGDQNASISLTATGGTAPYTYSWLPTIPDPNNVGAGAYNYTITDLNGFEVTGTVLISEPDAIELVSSSIPESDLNTNGSATVNPDGGTMPYTYLWSNGGTTQTIDNLSAGSYSVTVTDANDCVQTTSVAVDLFITPMLASVTTTNNPLLCFGDQNATANVEIVGGIPPFTVEWIPNADPMALGAGVYTIIITDSLGSTHNIQTMITQPDEITSEVSSTATMNSQSDGTASVIGSGGTPGYTYLWSTGENSATIENLSSGDYSVTITDANGCTSENNVFVDMITGISTTAIHYDLNIFPNPAKDFVLIQHSKGFAVDQLSFYNMLGETMPINYDERANELKVNWSKELATGVYLIRIKWEDGSLSSGRFVKE